MAVALAALAAVCWGLAEFLGGLHARRSAPLTVALIVQAAGVLPLVALLLARGDPGWPTPQLLRPAIPTGVLEAVAFAGMYLALARGSMARVAPIFAIAPIVPIALGLASGEAVGGVQLAGAVAALAGVVLLSFEGGARRGLRGLLELGPGLVPALVATTAIGLELAGLSRVAAHDPVWGLVVVRSVSVLTLACVTGAGLAARSAPRTRDATGAPPARALPLLALLGLLGASGSLLWTEASRRGLLVVVSVVGGLFPAVTALLAVGFLHERLSRAQTLGALAALAGGALVVAG